MIGASINSTGEAARARRLFGALAVFPGQMSPSAVVNEPSHLK